MSAVKQVKEAEFQSEVLKSENAVLVDFFAPWCGPCRALAPALEGIAKEHEGRLTVVKINVDEAPHIASTYKIQAVPTLMIFKEGKAVETMVGVPSANVLHAKLEAVAAQPEAVCGGGCCCCN